MKTITFGSVDPYYFEDEEETNDEINDEIKDITYNGENTDGQAVELNDEFA